MKLTNKVFIVMGVSGSGKSTVGRLLAEKFSLEFYDADDYHPEANIRKMTSGKALNDDDRQGWLERLNELIVQHWQSGLVLACSALKEKYRRTLAMGLEAEPHWIYLDGTYEEILKRLSDRKEHYMPPTLLKSQFETLEEPDYAYRVSIRNTPGEIVSQIMKNIK